MSGGVGSSCSCFEIYLRILLKDFRATGFRDVRTTFLDGTRDATVTLAARVIVREVQPEEGSLRRKFRNCTFGLREIEEKSPRNPAA